MEIPQKFDKIKDFNHKGWAEVNLNNKWGLLSNQGFEFFPVNFYDEVIDYEKGFAKVSLNGKWGIVNSSGREIIPCKYDEIQNFEKDGFAQLSSNHKWAFVNNSGKIITPFKYDIANMRGHYGGGYEFHQGLAAVNVGGKFQTFDADYSWNGGKWGFIDTTGKEVIPCQYDNVSQDANGNYDSAPAFSADGLVRLKIKGKCGCVDATGKEIIPFKYDSIGIFENGKAKVYQNGKEFYIDKSGNLVK
jgi:hypothetical protein